MEKLTRLVIITVLCTAFILMFGACKKENGYRTGTKVSSAYVNPDSIEKVKEEDIKAKGYKYDYDNLSYDLVWSDEFDYKGLPDETKWSYDVGGSGWGNNELEYYTASKNAYVEDGNLVIEAREEEYEGMNYTSARMITKGKGDWLYGKIEVEQSYQVVLVPGLQSGCFQQIGNMAIGLRQEKSILWSM